jgi:hypothetical protein
VALHPVCGILPRMAHPLTAWRARHEKTKASIAAACGKKWKAIHRVEKYEVLPTYDLAKRISAATANEVTVEHLIDNARPRVERCRRSRKRKAEARANAEAA